MIRLSFTVLLIASLRDGTRMMNPARCQSSLNHRIVYPALLQHTKSDHINCRIMVLVPIRGNAVIYTFMQWWFSFNWLVFVSSNKKFVRVSPRQHDEMFMWACAPNKTI